MFIASKILDLLAQPLAWIIATLAVACWLPTASAWGRRLSFLAMTLLLLIGWQPLPDTIIRQLESVYTEIPPDADLRGFTGVVILGGATEPGFLSQAHTQPLMNAGAERLVAPAALNRSSPQLRLLYSGGEGALFGKGPTESARAQRFFDTMGLPTGRVEYESVSRNTYENAILTAKLPGVDIQQPWLLLTSAWHMPRAMASFTKAGWNVTAYPVDFRTAPQTPWTEYSLSEGASRWQLALHELLGTVVYRWLGRL